MLITAEADISIYVCVYGECEVNRSRGFSVLAGENGKLFLPLWHRSASACRDIEAGRTKPILAPNH